MGAAVRSSVVWGWVAGRDAASLETAHKPGYTFGRPSGSERRALKGLDPVRPVPGLAGSR